MGIFKRHDQPAVQAGAAPAPEAGRQDKSTTLMPPFVSAPRDSAAPGVVPPPAALMFEMTPPDSGRAEADSASLVAERVRKSREPQQNVEERVRIAVQRARTASRSNGVRRVQAQQTAPASLAAWQQSRPSFDPVRCAQAGLLNLAWSWQQAGAPVRAIHAYMQVLCRYPDTPGAAAAVADLVELSEKLTDEGKYHLALSIYDELENVL